MRTRTNTRSQTHTLAPPIIAMIDLTVSVSFFGGEGKTRDTDQTRKKSRIQHRAHCTPHMNILRGSLHPTYVALALWDQLHFIIAF